MTSVGRAQFARQWRQKVRVRVPVVIASGRGGPMKQRRVVVEGLMFLWGGIHVLVGLPSRFQETALGCGEWV